jgi:hypothetical protein
VSTIARGFTIPWGMTFDSAGDLYVMNDKFKISRITPGGEVTDLPVTAFTAYIVAVAPEPGFLLLPIVLIAIASGRRRKSMC